MGWQPRGSSKCLDDAVPSDASAIPHRDLWFSQELGQLFRACSACEGLYKEKGNMIKEDKPGRSAKQALLLGQSTWKHQWQTGIPEPSWGHTVRRNIFSATLQPGPMLFQWTEGAPWLFPMTFDKHNYGPRSHMWEWISLLPQAESSEVKWRQWIRGSAASPGSY